MMPVLGSVSYATHHAYKSVYANMSAIISRLDLFSRINAGSEICENRK